MLPSFGAEVQGAKVDTAGAKAGTPSGENRAVVVRYVEEVWNRHDLGAIDGLVSPDYLNHAASEGHRRDGAEASVGWMLSVSPSATTASTSKSLACTTSRTACRWPVA